MAESHNVFTLAICISSWDLQRVAGPCVFVCSLTASHRALRMGLMLMRTETAQSASHECISSLDKQAPSRIGSSKSSFRMRE
jgi:hypothetical protein